MVEPSKRRRWFDHSLKEKNYVAQRTGRARMLPDVPAQLVRAAPPDPLHRESPSLLSSTPARSFATASAALSSCQKLKGPLVAAEYCSPVTSQASTPRSGLLHYANISINGSPPPGTSAYGR